MAPSIASVSIEGSTDPAGRVDALVATVAPLGGPFVESGEADRMGTPIGTVPRLQNLLKAVGYQAQIAVTTDGGGARLQIRLQPFDRVRQIFVSGNQPVFRQGVRQEEILRQLSIRNGQALPPAGERRDAFLDAEAARVRDYLHTQGFQDAEVRIALHATHTIPARVNLDVRVKPGPGYPPGKITVTGNRAISSKDIADGFRHVDLHLDWPWLWARHAPFRRNILRIDETALTQRYLKLGYPGVRISDDFDPTVSVDRKSHEVHLGIQVKERRRIELAFAGNAARSAGALADDVGSKSRRVYDDVDAAAGAETLEKSYRERGHMLVKITWRRERIAEDADRIVFTVDEGPVLKVRGVEFVGNHKVSHSTLAEEIRTKKFPLLGAIGLGEGGFATPRQIELDVQSLVDYYESIGRPGTKVRAEIAPAPGQWRPAPTGFNAAVPREDEPVWRKSNALYLRFLIEEAPVLWVANMRFQSVDPATPLPRDDLFLRKSLRTVLGAPFLQATVRRDEERLKRLMGDEGYRNATVESHIEREGDHVTIVWNIKLGWQVHLGPVFIRGNFLTTEDTIMTWAELRPGSLLTTRAVERAQRNLAMIQLFNNPNPVSFPSENPHQPVVPMVVEVEERHDHFGIVTIGGGISTDQKSPNSSFPVGGYAALGYEHRNLFGHAWTFISQAAYGLSLTRVSASFVDPRFFGSLFRLEIGGNYLRQATVRLGDLRSGATFVGFAREMFPGLDANIRYNFRDTFHTEFLARGAGADENDSRVSVGTIVGSISTSIDWHRLDNTLVPTRGFRVGVGAELALPRFSFDYGSDSFIKLSGHSLAVLPLLSWLSLRHSLRYDQGFPLAGASLLPRVERFFSGGDTTVRGYDLDRLLTETIYVPSAFAVQHQPVGGNLRLIQNIDLQFPIAAPWYGSVFLDSGVVAFSFDGLAASDFRHGLGFAPFVFKLPIGDLSLAAAIPLNPKPGDSSWRFHVNVGLMF
ncbi:MAG TPA: POTRA domain-containing protein [Polyangia bacterium]|nr:POTRA domain-containing protein [Polyangia bacterium]